MYILGGQVYSFGELPWKASQGTAVEKLSLESSLSGQQVVAIAAGSYHSGAVTDSGGVHMWGDNGLGQCGLSGLKSVPNPTPVAVLALVDGQPQTVRVLELACGAHHTLALSAGREVWAWGSGCQLGLGPLVVPVWKPQKVERLSGRYVLQVACGAEHSLALVRCQGQQEVQHPPVDKCRQCNQLLYTMTDKEDHVIISDSHQCTLTQELHKDEAAQDALALSDAAVALPSEPPLPSPAAPAEAEPPLPAASLGPRGSPYPDEQAVNDYLRRLSDSTPAKQEGKSGSLALPPVSTVAHAATPPCFWLLPAGLFPAARLHTQLYAQQPCGVLRFSRGGTSGLHLRGAVPQEGDELLPPFWSRQGRLASEIPRRPEQPGSRGGLGPGKEELQYGGHP